MSRTKISNFPLHKPFDVLEPATPLSELALRLVVNYYSDAPRIVGSATLLTEFLVVTARHVLEAVFDAQPVVRDGRVVAEQQLSAIQVLPGAEYFIWDVVMGWPCPSSDIALLQLGSNPGRSHPKTDIQWKPVTVDPFPPAINDRIAAIGYHSSVVKVSRNEQGGQHIDLIDTPTASVGIVKEHFLLKRDSAVLPFPCYEVAARFDAGMSGGPVFDEYGCLCGLVCSNVSGSHLTGQPISYVTSLWPLFKILISANRAGVSPRDVSYPAIELARGGQIAVVDIDRLERWLQEREGLVP